MSQTRAFYEGKYAEQSLEGDTRLRVNRLRYCLPPSMSGKRILDLGCGPGVQIAYLAAQNNLVGLDISFPALQRAKDNGYACCQVDLDGRPLPFKDGQFDVVLCTDLLEHLFDPLDTVREIGRVLRPDGVAFISVPNHFSLVMRLRILFGKGLIFPFHSAYRAWDYMHLRYLTLGDFKELLQEGGLNPVRLYAAENPSYTIRFLRLLLDRAYVADWARRNPKRTGVRWLMRIASAVARASLFPAVLAAKLPRLRPTLFCRHFFMECARKE